MNEKRFFYRLMLLVGFVMMFSVSSLLGEVTDYSSFFLGIISMIAVTITALLINELAPSDLRYELVKAARLRSLRRRENQRAA